MPEQPINFSSGIPTTVLPEPEPALTAALDAAMAADDRRAAIAAVVASAPRFLDGWAALGDCDGEHIDRYAAYRVGYHRGLDALRANGWRGSGYVLWAAPTNHGFLHCLVGLQHMAATIGEHDESERIVQFLAQLDPGGVPGPIATQVRTGR